MARTADPLSCKGKTLCVGLPGLLFLLPAGCYSSDLVGDGGRNDQHSHEDSLDTTWDNVDPWDVPPDGDAYVDTADSYVDPSDANWDPDQVVDPVPDADVLLDYDIPFTYACDALEADIVVPRDVPTIQAAIDLAGDGDTVCVEPGIYHEHLRIEAKRMILVGPAGPFRTIVDGDWTDRALRISGPMDSSTVIDGFTLRYGWNYNSWDFGAGGLTIDNASPTVRNVIVSDNITDSSFGSGVVISGSDSAPIFDNVVILRSEVESGFGAGLFLQGGADATFSHAIIADNWTFSGFGGGIFIDTEDSFLTLTNAIISDNRTRDGFGGGLFTHGPIGFVNVTVVGNTTRSGEGAGLAVQGSPATLTNVQIVENGISESGSGGGLFVEDGVTATLTSCNLWGNAGGDFSGIPDPIGTAGNISADPGFLDRSSEDPMRWDLHLSTGSPSVDAGAPTLADPDGSPSDIGAYGGPGAAGWDIDRDGFPLWWQPGPYDFSLYPSLGLDCNDLDPDIRPGAGC